MIVDVAVEHGYAMDEYVRLGTLAERYGIGTLWAPNGTSSRDAFVSLSGLARASSRIRMGIQAMSPYEMHPLKIANALLTLNELAHGRASILVGGGGAIFGAIGGKPLRRVRATQECIDILRRAGTGADGELCRRDLHREELSPRNGPCSRRRVCSPAPTCPRCCAWPRARPTAS